jgi:hypothetical protein
LVGHFGVGLRVLSLGFGDFGTSAAATRGDVGKLKCTGLLGI